MIMSVQEDLKKTFKKFEEAIKANNHHEIASSLKFIDSTEVSFLKNYHKRKKEGVYYTNDIISKFIITEALILFLNSKLGDNLLNSINEIYKLKSESKKLIYKMLTNIKICDPACGSGVFLLNAADLIYNLIKKLNPQLNESHIKNQILMNLYGLDINKYAIKLCILKIFAWFYQGNKQDFSKIISILKSNIRIENSLLTSNSVKFDIIIGNPPYGNILTKDEKDFLRNEKIFNKDIYCAFLLKALDWSNGIIGFLVPKSFLLRQGYINFRNKLFSSANLLRIYDIGPNLFKKATNEVQIILYQKTDIKNKSLKIYDYPNKEIITYPNQKTDSLKICFNSHCPLCNKSKKIYVYTFSKKCPYCGSETNKICRIRIKPTVKIYNLVNKIERSGDLNYLNIVDFPKLIRGEEDKGLNIVKKLLKADIKGTCFFINAKNDFRYYYIKKNKSFNIEEIDAKVLKGKNYEFYKNPKLLIKHNNIIPEAIFTEDNICFTSSIYSLLHDDINELKYLCAILNSCLIQFYCTYGINNQKDTTINLNQYMIRHLPIMKANGDIKSQIVSHVDYITNYLEKNKGTTSKSINQNLIEIDDIIFNLYSITEDERKIIISYIKNQIYYFKNIYD